VRRVNATPRRLSRGKGGTGRGRLGVYHLKRGPAVLGTRSSEAGVSNAIEQLLLHGGAGVLGEGWQWRAGRVKRAHAGVELAVVPWGRRQHTWAPISETSR